jgi:acyl-CoA reductase-like NAD-dependent aldehyde dehydrogenase
VSDARLETAGELRARIDAALAARARLRTRPLEETIAALDAAALRWSQDETLAAALPAATSLSPQMITAVMPIAAAALDAAAMMELVEDEWGRGAAARPVPDGLCLVAHVLASNVPALALPAIALACLAGATVVVKSGRRDALSAPAFAHALTDVDPDLAATVVTAYWPGGDVALEDTLLERADVAVLTGGDEALAALARRTQRRVIAYGPRVSVAAVGRGALDHAPGAEKALALDVALHDQRGCLSPHAVYVQTGGDVSPRVFAERLAGALDEMAHSLPRGEASVEERAAARACAVDAEWSPGSAVIETAGGTVLYEETTAFRPTAGLRMVRVHPLDEASALASVLPMGGIECVGLAGITASSLVADLRARGVSRVCPLGGMQQPPLAWPRGQQAPLGALLGRPDEPQLGREI